MKTLELITYSPDEQLEICELTRVPEIVKDLTDSCFRSAFFSENGKDNCYGPLTLTFAIRTAKDLLLEGCDYQGLDIKIETAGRLLPALPAFSEIQKLLESSDTIIHVNGQIYKPNNEVFGFQQVYDDSVKCIDSLKKLGFNNESMSLYATPEDITVEVSGAAIGLEGNSELSSRYYKLLCHLANIKEVAGKPQKTDIKTILLNTVLTNGRILLPGCIHPTMRRVKVGVGASHFAYGIAAFSDTCGKKHTKDECIQETLNWLKFIEKELSPVAGIRELLDTLPNIALPGKGNKSSVLKTNTEQSSDNTSNVSSTNEYIGVFQSLKSALEDSNNEYKDIPEGIPLFNTTINKALGKGLAIGGLHIVLGKRERGKSTFLLQQALLTENKMPVLYVSYEQNLRGFIANAACLIGGINKTEMFTGLVGANSKQIKLAMGAAIDKLQVKLSQNLFFSGIETGRFNFNADEILQLVEMLPESKNKLVVIESVLEEDLTGDQVKQLQKLKKAAVSSNLTVLLSVHVKEDALKHPVYIDGADLEYLSEYQRFSDTIINLDTERNNLRKFVSLVKGQVDAALVANLEQKALQLSGGKRLKSDTYSLFRIIHNRMGRRDMILLLYQPDMGRFFDLASVPLIRP